MSKATRRRAVDSKGRPVEGVYILNGRFIAGFLCPQTAKWRMIVMDAKDLTAARREREALVNGLSEGRIAAKTEATFADLFEDWQSSRTIADRTRVHEQHLLRRHLAAISEKPIQSITASDVAKAVRMPGYSSWSRVAVHRILKAVFGHAVLRGTLTKNPVDGLRPDERPKQKNAKKIARLSPDAVTTLLEAAPTKRWKAALALAALAGLRLGEIRALTWADVDGAVLRVSKSALPDGTVKSTKTEAGNRAVPISPALRAILVEWKLASPRSFDTDPVISTWNGNRVSEAAVRKSLLKATEGMVVDGRLSMHSLRHSYASTAILSGLAPTTVARIAGHADPATTLSIYARDERPEADVVADVLAAMAR